MTRLYDGEGKGKKREGKKSNKNTQLMGGDGFRAGVTISGNKQEKEKKKKRKTSGERPLLANSGQSDLGRLGGWNGKVVKKNAWKGKIRRRFSSKEGVWKTRVPGDWKKRTEPNRTKSRKKKSELHSYPSREKEEKKDELGPQENPSCLKGGSWNLLRRKPEEG